MYRLLKFYEKKAIEYLEKYMKEKKESNMWYKTYIVLMFYFMYLLSC